VESTPSKISSRLMSVMAPCKGDPLSIYLRTDNICYDDILFQGLRARLCELETLRLRLRCWKLPHQPWYKTVKH
jgi:hypothetical protein